MISSTLILPLVLLTCVVDMWSEGAMESRIEGEALKHTKSQVGLNENCEPLRGYTVEIDCRLDDSGLIVIADPPSTSLDILRKLQG